MKKQLLFLMFLCFSLAAYAKKNPVMTAEDSAQVALDNIEKSFTYQTGTIDLGENLAKIQVPAGFRFLNAKQTDFVIYDLWGNPRGKNEKLLGMIVPENRKITEAESWAFIIEYDDMGYVKDDDADNINYDDMLKELQESEKAENQERTKMGFPAVHIVGWAQKPYYDKVNKTLHWAKEISFGEGENTLNYNVRILGRKGILVLNAVGSMHSLSEINQNIAPVISSVAFSEGNKYSDYNSSVDKVAAWSIGGLVAGKVLAKAGFFAILAKFGKIIFLAIAAGAASLWRWITGRKNEEEQA